MRNKGKDILSPETVQQVLDPSKKIIQAFKDTWALHVIWSVSKNNTEFWHEKEIVCQLSCTCVKAVKTLSQET